MIRQQAPTTRAALAEASGLTPAAITKITKKMLDEGLIVVTGKQQGGRGQPGIELGINPQIDGQIIRLRIPDLTEERRKELIKILKSMTEKNKVSIRNIRREANEELKKKLKEKKITEDENKNYEKNTQKLTDDHISVIDKITAEKEKEVGVIVLSGASMFPGCVPAKD